MRSIRLSLVLYFLVLLTIGLSAAGWLVYGTATRSLAAERAVTRAQVEAQYEDRCRQESTRFDDALLRQARVLASLSQSQYQANRAKLASLQPLGLLSALPSPHGHVTAPLWGLQGLRGHVSFRIYRALVGRIEIDEDELPPEIEGVRHEFYQIHSEWGGLWRSVSLEDRILPLDRDVFAMPLLDWRFDSLEMTGLSLRRVILKTPASRFKVVWGGPPPRWSRPGDGPPSSPSRPLRRGENRPNDRMTGPGYVPPVLFVQCAADTERLQAALTELRTERDQRLNELDAESAHTLTNLQQRLAWIGLGTFTATLLGGLLLVSVGLAPLRRLTEAVRRVHANNLQLRLSLRELPIELAPVARTLQTALNDLRQAFDREKQATADISHELRTPLAALLTTTEVALRKPRSAEELRQALEECRHTARQMHQLVERLLTLAKLDAGAVRVQFRPADLCELAGDCLKTVRPLAEARQLRLELKASAPTVIATDPERLRDVLVNLLHNAVEYNRPGGSVTLAVSRDAREACLEVADTGVGMSESVQSHLFERFYRADAARQETGVHAGLGLAIVKETLRHLGGRIEVESTEGIGSAFRVRLPTVASEEHS